jgi:hypothetical protein
MAALLCHARDVAMSTCHDDILIKMMLLPSGAAFNRRTHTTGRLRLARGSSFTATWRSGCLSFECPCRRGQTASRC